MKTLYITSAATALFFLLFLVLMSSINSPLGGEPFSVTLLSSKKQAEMNLADQRAAIAAEKNKKPARQKTVEQKEPRYFNADKDTNVVLSGEALLRKQNNDEVAHLKVSTPDMNSLELADVNNVGLPLAPDPDLIEKSKYGLLPRIAPNGKRAQDVYARPNFIARLKDKNIKTISILVTNLGLSKPVTDNAIEKLPPEITLSFNPYSKQLNSWVKRARRNGHELMLQLPMEPFDYPDNDPGPHTLLNDLSDTINLQRLKWLMSRMTGYVGMVNISGSKFSSDENALHPILHELKVRGLTYMDAHPQAPEVPYQISRQIKLDYLQGSLIIDRVQTKSSIDLSLAKLEEMAQSHGSAIGIMTALPLSIQRITEWSVSLKKKGINLVPISASLVKQS